MTTPAIRPLTRNELDTLINWAADEGWNPGLADADAFYAADPKGFLGCFVEGELVAGISAVAYDEHFGFIGLYICHPRFRGQGYGRKVWNAGMAYLGDRIIGLDGVPEQQANYAAMGFAPLYETVRWSGPGTTSARSFSPPAASVRPIQTTDIPALGALDRRHFPAPRADFLSLWLDGAHDAFVAMEDGAVSGYAVLRKCRQGRKIGPLFALDDSMAENLLTACLQKAGSDEVHLDVPDHQVGLTEILIRHGFQPGFKTARMYRGMPPRLALAGVYAVTSLELG